MPDLELFLEKLPHYWDRIEGGEIVFYCKNGSKYACAIASGTTDIETRDFWQRVGQHPEYTGIEWEHYSENPPLLCQSDRWHEHPACAGCPKKPKEEEKS